MGLLHLAWPIKLAPGPFILVEVAEQLKDGVTYGETGLVNILLTDALIVE